MSNSVQPHRGQPTRLPRPWDSLGKNTGVGCHLGIVNLFQDKNLTNKHEDHTIFRED